MSLNLTLVHEDFLDKALEDAVAYTVYPRRDRERWNTAQCCVLQGMMRKQAEYIPTMKYAEP
jgi:hypothetical protein